MTEHDPAEAQWHHWPRCWYPAARAGGFKPGQVRSGRPAGREWVLYRAADDGFHPPTPSARTWARTSKARVSKGKPSAAACTAA
ncbi:hypothetical protein [Neisseria bacilliformis]|uniref:hypothetical protein n=1 Tax=Neisseria bacilliformis TaxID=267212 RepID=UPI0028E6A2E0|nr:hypothetical protein [Neisseria bacilliformis]